MQEFFDLYASWLASRGETHLPERFRHWVHEVYQPPQGAAALELLTSTQPSGMLPISLDEPATLAIRVWNTSGTDLRMSKGLLGGLHLRWTLSNATRDVTLRTQPGGLRDVTIPPGESADLGVFLPPLDKPGRYWVKVELFDTQNGSYSNFGSSPLYVELDVR